MNISIEEKRIEAVVRMKRWGIYNGAISQFKKEGLVSISEPPLGIFFWVEGRELEAVKEFEKEHNALVYCIVRSYTTIGKMDAYLFVSDYKEEWEMDRRDQIDGQQLAYVVNYDMPDCSEFGSIGLAKTMAGGLRRTW